MDNELRGSGAVARRKTLDCAAGRSGLVSVIGWGSGFLGMVAGVARPLVQILGEPSNEKGGIQQGIDGPDAHDRNDSAGEGFDEDRATPVAVGVRFHRDGTADLDSGGKSSPAPPALPAVNGDRVGN